MTPKRATRRSAEPDRLIGELAGRQHGVVAGRQLRALGLSVHHIRTRTRTGRLHRCHRDVYAVGHRSLGRHGRWLAAVLACGDGAVLSHTAAAALWQIVGPRGPTAPNVDVTVPSGAAGRRQPGLIVHRCRDLFPEESTAHDGVPVTTPARTILDLAACIGFRSLERMADEAERLRLCGTADLEKVVAAHRGRRGAGALRRLLAAHAIGSTATRSELEERFLALCRRRRLPPPLVNVPLLDYVADFYWPAARLVVEVDGHGTHGTRVAFERDRDRDSHLAAHGYRTLRFTWRDLTTRPAIVAHRVRRVLHRG